MILFAEPREFTFVNLAGAIDLDTLADLSGHFGMPKIEQAPRDKVRKM